MSVLAISLTNLHEGSGIVFLGVWACPFGMWCCWPMQLIVILEKCQKFTHSFHAVIKGSQNLTHIYKSAVLSLFLNNWFLIVIMHWYQQCTCHFMSLQQIGILCLKIWKKHSVSHSFIHSVFCLTTGPKPPPKRCLHIVRS